MPSSDMIYVAENGFDSIDIVATQTGIAQKNISRFAGYQGIEIPENTLSVFSGIILILVGLIRILF